jgi:branched-chain amino acid transport system permease protein
VSLALQVVVSGLAAGAVYGLVAVGHALIYRLTGVVHFAFGDLVGLGVFAALLVTAGSGPVTQESAGAGRFLVGLAVGLGVCVVAGAGTYAWAVQPYVSRGSTLGWVTATVAIAFAIRAALSAIFPRPSYVFPDPLPFRDVGREGFVTVGGASVQVRAAYVVAVALALALLATWVLARTAFGRGLRAVAADAEGARIVGVPVERLVALAFALAGGAAALAAVVAAPSAPVDVDTGTLLGLKGLVAALLVRFGAPLAAFAAGIGVGLLESAVANLSVFGLELGPEYRDVVPLALAFLLVALRPLAEAMEERA